MTAGEYCWRVNPPFLLSIPFCLSCLGISRGYPKNLILSSLKRSLELDMDTLLNKETLKVNSPPTTTVNEKEHTTKSGPTFYCITTHNPNNPPIKEIITKNWHLVQKTKTTRHLEDARLIFGLRRNKNLSDHLVALQHDLPPRVDTLLNTHVTDHHPVNTAPN